MSGPGRPPWEEFPVLREIAEEIRRAQRLSPAATERRMMEVLVDYSSLGEYASRSVRLEHYARSRGWSQQDLASPRRARILAHVDDATFQYWYDVLREQEILARRGQADVRPTGRYALALERLGYRTAGSPFPGRRDPQSTQDTTLEGEQAA